MRSVANPSSIADAKQAVLWQASACDRAAVEATAVAKFKTAMRRAAPILRVVVPLLFLALTFCLIDAEAALALLRRAEILPILGGLLVMQVQIVLSAYRWRYTANRLGQRLGAGHAVREYYLTTLVNQIVPGGMAGDAVRAARNRITDEDGRARWGVAVRAIFLERLAGQTAFILVTATGLIGWPFLVGRAAPDASGDLLLGVVALVLGIGIVFGALAILGPRRLRSFARSLGPDMRRAYFSGAAWLVQGVVSLALVATYVGVFAFAALAIGAPVPWYGLVTVMPLAILTMLVPVSVGGWGLREAAAAALWPLVGLASSAGVASAILYGLISLAGALPGILFWRRRHRQPVQSASRA